MYIASKLVVRHDELENVKHEVLRDALLEVSWTRNLFHWIGLKSWPQTCEFQTCLCIISWDTKWGGEVGIHLSQTYIRQKKPNRDRVNINLKLNLKAFTALFDNEYFRYFWHMVDLWASWNLCTQRWNLWHVKQICLMHWCNYSKKKL